MIKDVDSDNIRFLDEIVFSDEIIFNKRVNNDTISKEPKKTSIVDVLSENSDDEITETDLDTAVSTSIISKVVKEANNGTLNRPNEKIKDGKNKKKKFRFGSFLRHKFKM